MLVLQEDLFRKEEKLKETVYSKFDILTAEALSEVNEAKQRVEEEEYEDQDAFMIHSNLLQANKKRQEVEALVGKLYDSPYFAHVEVAFANDDEENVNFFLSDCETLEEVVPVENGGMLLPFKQDDKKPISNALFHCYQTKKGLPISYKGASGNDVTIIPKLICNTEIYRRHLQDVVSLYPQMDISQITADELLELKLQENRDNPVLRNIISTLQQVQFEIIEKNTTESFVVQGCAGSGKSQCMLHRLFFLRDTFVKSGWDKVLLLTPTKLFRQYSADLIRRYQLSDVRNCSIADLYRDILYLYDARFKDRQYKYQMTEEYLPDQYLYEVYSEDNVGKIEAEIDNAIKKYVKAGCAALGKNVPEIITAAEIYKIVNMLDAQIKEYDLREEKLQGNEEYREKRALYEEQLKTIEGLKKKQQRYFDEQRKNEEKRVQVQRLTEELDKVKQESQEWKRNREKRISDAAAELEKYSKGIERGIDLRAPAKYARQLFLVKDMTEGDKFREEEDYAKFLDEEYVPYAQEELDKIVGDKKSKNVFLKYEKKEQEIRNNLNQVEKEIGVAQEKAEELEKWIKSVRSGENNEASAQTLLRDDMERARYFLSRIESTVFEQEVWDALASVKERYNIQTLVIEELKDGKRKESKILYKADLLFYVKIYLRLYPDTKLPEYNLLCIDEGQDLHRADYDILHAIYKNAAFNVFGDVAQVLHPACGISDWKAQTGISTVYPLMTNYRNTGAIVNFCNKKFGIDMEYIGSVDKQPEEFECTKKEDAKKILLEEKVILIVKDYAAYEKLCNMLEMPKDEYAFLDTLSERDEKNKKECYSIYAAKGLEFKDVFVYADRMTKNQKVVACTRAMGGLYYYE